MPKTLNWYPGHMKKAMEELTDRLPLFDIILEIIDARCPMSSLNQNIETIAKNNNKKIIYIATKRDLADERISKLWEQQFKKEGKSIYFINVKENKLINTIKPELNKIIEEKIAKNARRGLINAKVRMIVVGVPNVGKSTIINSLAKRAATMTGNKPGVTRAQQIIRVDKNVEVIDTPGIMMPKIDEFSKGCSLVLSNIIRLEILNYEEIATYAMEYMTKHYVKKMNEKWQLDFSLTDIHNNFEILAKRLNFIKKDNELDLERTYIHFIREIQNSSFGKVSFEVV